MAEEASEGSERGSRAPPGLGECLLSETSPECRVGALQIERRGRWPAILPADRNCSNGRWVSGGRPSRGMASDFGSQVSSELCPASPGASRSSRCVRGRQAAASPSLEGQDLDRYSESGVGRERDLRQRRGGYNFWGRRRGGGDYLRGGWLGRECRRTEPGLSFGGIADGDSGGALQFPLRPGVRRRRGGARSPRSFGGRGECNQRAPERDPSSPRSQRPDGNKDAPANPGPKAKAGVGSRAGPAVEAGLPGLDPAVVKSARLAGIPEAQLEKMSKLVGGARKLPVEPRGGGLDPLDDEEEEDGAEARPGKGGGSELETVVVQMSRILQHMHKDKKPGNLEDVLDRADGGSDPSGASSSGGRSKAAAYQKLKSLLRSSPAEISKAVERCMSEDFTLSQRRAGARPASLHLPCVGWNIAACFKAFMGRFARLGPWLVWWMPSTMEMRNWQRLSGFWGWPAWIRLPWTAGRGCSLPKSA